MKKFYETSLSEPRNDLAVIESIVYMDKIDPNIRQLFILEIKRLEKELIFKINKNINNSKKIPVDVMRIIKSYYESVADKIKLITAIFKKEDITAADKAMLKNIFERQNKLIEDILKIQGWELKDINPHMNRLCLYMQITKVEYDKEEEYFASDYILYGIMTKMGIKLDFDVNKFIV